MKITSSIAMLSLSFGVVILSFQKPTKPIRSLPRGVHALVNNTPWRATSYQVHIDTEAEEQPHAITLPADYKWDSARRRRLFIYAFDSITQSDMEIRLYNFFKDTGTYSIDYSSEGRSVAYYFNKISPGFESDSGSMVINQLSDSNIQGAFNFFTDSGIIIRNGTFNIDLNRR